MDGDSGLPGLKEMFWGGELYSSGSVLELSLHVKLFQFIAQVQAILGN